MWSGVQVVVAKQDARSLGWQAADERQGQLLLSRLVVLSAGIPWPLLRQLPADPVCVRRLGFPFHVCERLCAKAWKDSAPPLASSPSTAPNAAPPVAPAGPSAVVPAAKSVSPLEAALVAGFREVYAALGKGLVGSCCRERSACRLTDPTVCLQCRR